MKHLFSIISVIIFPITVLAQYTQQGKIAYERKVNVYAQMEDNEDEGGWVERAKAQMPKFKVTYFDLYFNMDKSLYKPGRKTDEKAFMFGSSPAADNSVFTDFNTRQVTASKLVYEKNFLVKDTMRRLQWKITDEIRTIGDYKCRKAVSKICDSVYVVAFYSDDILVSGGPEMFSGLPGMIMELAIPRLHTTWTAIKVEMINPGTADMVAPGKGKQVTEQGLYETIKNSFSDWGKSAARNIWWCLL